MTVQLRDLSAATAVRPGAAQWYPISDRRTACNHRHRIPSGRPPSGCRTPPSTTPGDASCKSGQYLRLVFYATVISNERKAGLELRLWQFVICYVSLPSIRARKIWLPARIQHHRATAGIEAKLTGMNSRNESLPDASNAGSWCDLV